MFRFFIQVSLIFNLFFFSAHSEIFNEIIVEGNKRISKETIIVLSEIDLSKDLNDNDINSSIKSLYSTNFFEDVLVEKKNNRLKISVIENPIIDEILFKGVKSDRIVELLKDNMKLKNRMSFTENLFNNDLSAITNILKSNGYYFSKVKTALVNDDELNSVKIIINIDLGKKAKIKKISFIGDKKIKDKKLLEIIVSEENKFWKFISNKVYLNSETINLDIRLLENFYKNMGFYNVVVNDTFAEFDNDNGYFNLVYNINAGEKFFFNDFVLNIPNDYNLKDFAKIIKTFENLKGKVYSLDKINQILQEIDNIATFKLYDFIDATVDTQTFDTNKINFTFNIKEDDKFYVEKIQIFGNYTTIEEVIRNKLIVDEGDPFNKLLFNKSIDNIKSLGIFKNVSTNVDDGSGQNLKIITIDVEEKPTGEISLAAGVGSSGSSIGAGIQEKNFLGKGINLNTNIELSADSIKGQFIYSKPNFAYTDNTLFTSLKSTSSDNLADFGYKVSTVGLSIGTEFEQFENLFFSPEIEISIEDLTTNANATNNLKKQEGSYQDLYFNYGLTYDTRNSSFNPSSGNSTYFGQNLPLASNNNELTNTFLFTQYKTLSQSSNMIGKASLYFKAINSLDDSDVRISKRPNVPYSRLRGFEKGKIGPKDNDDFIGGNYVSALNLSTNIPTFLNTIENIDFRYFFDFANVWGVDYDKSINDSNKLRSSTGLGVDLLTPIGPLSFSFSQPISKKSTDKTETFRFNLGTTF